MNNVTCMSLHHWTFPSQYRKTKTKGMLYFINFVGYLMPNQFKQHFQFHPWFVNMWMVLLKFDSTELFIGTMSFDCNCVTICFIIGNHWFSSFFFIRFFFVPLFRFSLDFIVKCCRCVYMRVVENDQTIYKSKIAAIPSQGKERFSNFLNNNFILFFFNLYCHKSHILQVIGDVSFSYFTLFFSIHLFLYFLPLF